MKKTPGEPDLGDLDVAEWFTAAFAAAGFLVSIYLPAVLVVRGLGFPLPAQVPLLMLVTAGLAAGWAFLLIRFGPFELPEFGLRVPKMGALGLSALVAVVPAIAVAILSSRLGQAGPLHGLKLPAALMWLYFAVGAPVQEEWIFRGLLQGVATRVLSGPGGSGHARRAALAGSLVTAVVFALAHLTIGVWTALAALVLGLLAGEARRRSGSVLPAIAVHSIFNIAGLLLVLIR